MNSDLHEWVRLLLRWIHVFAGILWAGTTYYFTWLDGRFNELEKASNPDKKDKSSEPNRVWMVQSGGFFVVETQRVPAAMPGTLHWFRWEALFTWISGMLLLVMLYYHGGLMVDLADSRISNAAAIWLSVGLLIVSVPVYELLWFKLARNERLGIALSIILVVGVSWFLARYFAGRTAYMQLGAMFGTIMTANVWMRILPAQRRMVAALKAGGEPNQAEAKRAKACSKHNTFMVVPVVVTMISSHFPTITYGSRYNWIILSALVFVGWVAAKFLRRA
jgi:uncharacterized membrane protein